MLTARSFVKHLMIGRRGSWLGVVPLALLLSNFALIAAAQQYLTLHIDEKAKQLRGTAQACVQTPATYATDKAKFEEYFTGYQFPAMTRTEPDKLGEIGKNIREDLFKTFLWKSNNPVLQHDLTQLAFTWMGKIVSADNPPCHPAARYNAILIIGLLDEPYSPDGKQPGKPFGPATKALTGVVDQATKGNRFPPPVILGALVGLERHAQLHDGVAPELLGPMQAALLKLVLEDKPIQEMDRDTYSWMRLRAASALTKLGSVGEKNAIHNAIVHLVSTMKSLDDRCEAAALLDRLNYKDIKLDDAGTAEPMFALTRDVAASEDQRAQDFQDHGSSGFATATPGRPGMDSYGSSGTDSNAFQRRTTLSRLSDLQLALNKVKPSLPTETQKKVEAVLNAIKPAFADASNKDKVDLKLAESIHTMNAAINKAIPGPAKPEADKSKEAVF